MADITEKRPDEAAAKPPVMHGEVKLIQADEAVDEALRDIIELGGDIAITKEDNKRILHKIDWILIPLMCVLYSMQLASPPSSGPLHSSANTFALSAARLSSYAVS